MYTCKYCNNVFSSVSVLNRHMRKAKYCMRSKNQNKDLLCTGCGKGFATKQTLRNHSIICKSIIEIDQSTQANKSAPITQVIEPIQLMKIIQSIQATQTPQILEPVNKDQNDENIVTRKDLDELRDLIATMKTSNPAAPVVQNMEPVTVAHIEAMALEHLDISDIENGIEGIVDFTIKYPLQGRVVCTDKARRKFRYTDESGNIVNDYGGTQLSKTVFEGIQSRCVDLIDQKYATLANDIRTAVENNKGYEDSVLTNMQQSTQLQNLKKSLMDAAKGAENELQKGYIRKLVKELR